MTFHQHVPHPRDLLTAERHANDFLMERLARLFGSPWTVWLFMVVPLLAEYWAFVIQNVVFFLSSAWIQLFALPLLTYIGNKADKLRVAKADADHAALVHLATQQDDTHRLTTALCDQLGIDPQTGQTKLPRPRS